MKALILGNGGREEALAWKAAQSPILSKVYIAPGNAGLFPKCENVSLDLSNFEEIAAFIKDNEISLLIIGPEKPLVDGLTDFLQKDANLKDLHIVGPTALGARLEGSKSFAKAFMEAHDIPTAAYRSFTGIGEIPAAQAFIKELGKGPYVLKADGLAAGKGVLIIEQEAEASAAVAEMLEGKFGVASNTVVIEQYLNGIECSVFFLTDGKSYTVLPVAKDYKRIGDGDTGPNTGGMGAVSPVPFADELFLKKVEERIIRRTVEGLSPDVFKGFVFLGLMNVDGEPYVIEYNVRMGDPETEAVMLRIDSDLVPYYLSLRDEKLDTLPPLSFIPKTAVTVIMASGGYPDNYQKGLPITGIEAATSTGAILFHAGTTVNGEGMSITSGGRVIAVSTLGDGLQDAIEKSYRAANLVQFQDSYFRHDIGKDLQEWS